MWEEALFGRWKRLEAGMLLERRGGNVKTEPNFKGSILEDRDDEISQESKSESLQVVSMLSLRCLYTYSYNSERCIHPNHHPKQVNPLQNRTPFMLQIPRHNPSSINTLIIYIPFSPTAVSKACLLCDHFGENDGLCERREESRWTTLANCFIMYLKTVKAPT